MLTASIQRFKEECKVEGKMEGRLEGKLESIKTLVTVKFGIICDEEVNILKTMPEEKLDMLLRHLLNLKSYDDFKAQLLA